jgi:uncharacterized protein (UPF0303 family)
MSKEQDLQRVIEQEQALVFDAFDEAVAFELGCALRERAIAEQLGIAIEIRTGERCLFHVALPGTSADNGHWLRRKGNLVHRTSKSSYRVVLEHAGPQDYFGPRRGLDNMDYALAGGGFPIRVRQAGMIGSLCVSGLHERDDHGLAVAAIARHLALDVEALALPAL